MKFIPQSFGVLDIETMQCASICICRAHVVFSFEGEEGDVFLVVQSAHGGQDAMAKLKRIMRRWGINYGEVAA